WNSEENLWVELADWTEGETLPSLLEMTLADPFRPPLRVVFEIPKHATQAAEESATTDDSTTRATGSESRTSVTPASGRAQPAATDGNGAAGGERRGGGRRQGGRGQGDDAGGGAGRGGQAPADAARGGGATPTPAAGGGGNR